MCAYMNTWSIVGWNFEIYPLLSTYILKALFEEAIKKTLSSKARIVCLSSNYHLLPQFSKIIVMNNGRIAAMGPYSEIIDAFPEYALATSEHQSQHSHTGKSLAHSLPTPPAPSVGHEIKSADISEEASSLIEQKVQESIFATHRQEIEARRTTNSDIMTVEDKAEGAVTAATYVNYFGQASDGRGFSLFGFILLFFAITQIGNISNVHVRLHVLLRVFTENLQIAVFSHKL
jgi:hypothetical protein